LNYRTSKKKGANRKMPEDKWIFSEGKHAALISDEIFEKAKSIMKKKSKSPVKSSKSLSNALAGIAVCGICGAKMRYRSYSKSDAHLICVNKCGNKSSKYAYIEARILFALQKYLDEYNFDITNMPENPSSHVSVLKSSIALLEKRLNDAYIQKENIYNFLEKSVYSLDVFHQRSDSITQKIETLKNTIAETTSMYEKALNQKNHTAQFIPHITKVITEYPNLKTADAKNLLLKSVLKKVEYIKSKDRKNDNFEIRVYPLL